MTLVRHTAFVLAAFAVLAVARTSPAGPADDLKSKDVDTRIAAVTTLHESGGDDVEKLLLSALKDKDWEVVELAAAALGKHGSEKSVRSLLKLAIEGPTRRVRLAAAAALSQLAPEETGKALSRKVSGKSGIKAAEALSVLATSANGSHAAEGIVRGLKSADMAVKSAAARGVAALPDEDRADAVRKLLKNPDLRVRAAAADALTQTPEQDLVPLLIDALGQRDLNDTIERRLIAGIHAAVTRNKRGDDATAAAEGVFERLLSRPSGTETARLARAVGRIAAMPPQAGEGEERLAHLVKPERAVTALEAAVTSADATARSAGVVALGHIRTETALARAKPLITGDAEPRVRMHALRAFCGGKGMTDEEAIAIAAKVVSEDTDPMVREQACVLLGQPGIQGMIPTLRKPIDEVLDDKKEKAWSLAVAAAVSIGKTKDAEGVDVLAKLLDSAKDWKLRGAAVVGLGHIEKIEAVPHLIDAMSASESAVSRSAYEFLRRLPSKEAEAKLERKQSSWKSWWAKWGPDYEFIDREEAARKAKKYGYAPTNLGIYEGLDVVVLQSRGDHIEQLLGKLVIEHRITRQGAVPDAELHPFAVFVSNCTGEITEKDVEQLAWFVRVGGYLFCSCWALHHTAEKVYPGVVRKYDTKAKGQVLDNVLAEECPTDSPYLDEVFDGITRPIYVLYGAHLIEVMDPERCEVLMDSPDCASRWDCGNLAVWFDAGHGVILDSANHFDLQGLEKAEGLKSAEDRMAYAMDHMGLSYQEVRNLAEEKVWAKRNRAAKTARDLSAFRLISNFVRNKRLTDN